MAQGIYTKAMRVDVFGFCFDSYVTWKHACRRVGVLQQLPNTA